ncbi:MAG: hypothetical protein JSU65_11225 [Candidatus Zixiibacteriota bacterium]|nr:MAG: hypothetical protein JSU65_11225 [candidate division Zixibacteria bacterium]
MDCFSRSEIDVAVVETGLGGRLDATNVLQPCLTVTTSIDYDHTEILGSTIAEIATEKAGIVKESVPHLIGTLPKAAVGVMQRLCKARNSDLVRLRQRDYRLRSSGREIDFSGQKIRLKGVTPGLWGVHQAHNCILALKACDLLSKTGFRFSRARTRQGLSSVEWPGRFQVLSRPGKPTLVLDVCHNASGAEVFASAFESMYPGRKGAIILGLVKGKEHQRIVTALSRIASRFALVPMKTRRSADLAGLIESLNWSGIRVGKYGRLDTAYRRLLKTADADDIIGIVGSHYLVGEFLGKNKL